MKLNTPRQPAFCQHHVSGCFLFLDDIRQPEDAYGYTKQLMFVTKFWHVVRSYNEFKEWIEKNGLPTFISFDHDLADTHYTPAQVHTEKTGYECAKWLVDYCLDNGLKCPAYYCHSMNPVGKDKIVGLLRSFSNSR